MVEGHQCHRVAHAHRSLLQGKAFQASSPNGRFTDGAAAISNKPLTRIEVHGKNLFYFFSDAADADDVVVVHIHFGMSGAFKTAHLPGPDPTDTTRLQLVHKQSNVVALLSAMTVQHGTSALYHEKIAKLGPDPLREDAEKEVVWQKVAGSRKAIGLLLMDQSVIAGIGNIYRAEILFKAGVHPEQPGNSVTRAAFERIWEHSVSLLQRGFLSGSILTVDPEEARLLGKPWTRRYIYNQKSCGRCGSSIRAWDMATRTAYACETCQPLGAGTQLPVGRAAALAGADAPRLFNSHCAPDDADDKEPAKMTVAELRAGLRGLQLDAAGGKAALVARLEAALLSSPGKQSSPAAAAATGGRGRGKGNGVEIGAEVAGGSKAADLATPQRGRRVGTHGAAEGQADGVVEGEAAARQVKRRGWSGAAGTRKQVWGEEGGEEGDKDAVDVADEMLARSMAVPTTPPATASPHNYSKMAVPQLKQLLRSHSLPVAGRKLDLITRLQAHDIGLSQAAAGHGSLPSPSPLNTPGQSEASTTPPAPSGSTPAAPLASHITTAAGGLPGDGNDALPKVRPGTRQLGQMVSAQEAEWEKARAGENRAVEHVALVDEFGVGYGPTAQTSEAAGASGAAAGACPNGVGGSELPVAGAAAGGVRDVKGQGLGDSQAMDGIGGSDQGQVGGRLRKRQRQQVGGEGGERSGGGKVRRKV